MASISRLSNVHGSRAPASARADPARQPESASSGPDPASSEPARASETIDSLKVEIHQRTNELAKTKAALADSRRMLEAIHRAEARFIVEDAGPDVFEGLLQTLLELTGSGFGIIQEAHGVDQGPPLLVTRAAQNSNSRPFEEWAPDLGRLKDLCERAVNAQQPLVDDGASVTEPAGDAENQVALPAFLALPLRAANDCVGVLGLAGREDGYDAHQIDYLEPLVTSCGNLMAAWRSAQQRMEAEESLKRQNSELMQQKDRLRDANEELEAFSYSVSHDLRAPLRSVDSFSRILLEDYGPSLDDEGKRLFGIVRSEAQRMGTLIDDLLNFSRLGRQALEPTRLDMVELARQIYEEIPAESREHIERFDVEPLPPEWGDRVMLRQVLANLVGNAVKFTSTTNDAHIELGAEQRDGETAYYVRDNGVGFDARFAHKLFGVFQRLHAEEEFEGTGVGLAIVKRIVHLHGGRVWAESSMDGGATFWFSLPIRKEQ